MSLLSRFIDPATVSLKICGVTRREDADRLVDLGVDALGVNFWPRSKRHLPESAAGWLRAMEGKIVRVGVFVNQQPDLPLRLIHEGLIDVVQVHGDERPEDVAIYQANSIPFFKGIGVGSPADLTRAADYVATAILLDAHAPGVYGGTGEAFDWNTAVDFKSRHPDIPLLLAGGIVPENAATAAATVHPAAIDVASGAESSPGVKDFGKVERLLAALAR
jgi:phosphoribosylanthranilate isomerase